MRAWLRAGLLALLWPVVLALGIAAQSKPSTSTPTTTSLTTTSPDKQDKIEIGYSRGEPDGDRVLLFMAGGIRIMPRKNEVIRAQSGVATVDREAWEGALQTRESDAGLPRRAAAPPDPRRQLDAELLRSRLEGFLRSASRGRSPNVDKDSQPRLDALADTWFSAFRTLYLEGDVVVIQAGVETVHCERMWFSVLDDRAVFENVELRMLASGKESGGGRTLVLRAKQLVRQGPRTVGRDLSIASCTAGTSHIDLEAKEAEILERGDALEVRANGNTLRLSGTRVLPLPALSFMTDDESELPIEHVHAGYSSTHGFEASLGLGGSWNDIGGALHHAITGRDASEFRGKWHAELGWIEKRGYPLRGDLEYRARDQWRGRTQAYWLDDAGKNLSAIGSRFDGTPIKDKERTLLHSENRLRFSESTTLDVTAHQASDPAVWSDLFSREFYEGETPETSLHLRSATENRLFTATGRFNLDGWSYTDSRALAPSFVREAPLLTYDWFSQPIAETPWHTPVLLTSSTSAGMLEHDFDATNKAAIPDRTLRIDQELKLAAPFTLGSLVAVRPFASLRATHYDETAIDGADDRFSYATGLSIGSRFERTWSWTGLDGERKALRHVISPVVTWVDRWRVDGRPSNFRSFDEVDSLTEQQQIRFEVLNRLQRMNSSSAPSRPRDRVLEPQRRIDDLVWLDLAQSIYPDPTRDNGGNELGLFEYEIILRPNVPWLPLPNPRFLFEGERDWNKHTWRTANFGVAFGPLLGVDWRGEYRTDQTERGQIGYGGSAVVFQRWILSGGSQYDLDRHRTNNYSTEIVRVDHDWRIHLRLSYDNVSQSTSFAIDFEPTLGGLVQPRGSRWIAGSRLYSERGDFTNY